MLLHLSSKWSKIKGQKTFNFCFWVQGTGILWARALEGWWVFNRIFNRTLQAHLQGLPCPAGSSVCATPQNHFPAALKVCSFPRDYPIHIHSLVPQEGFFPWIFLFPNCKQHQKQDASTELSLCHALVTHSLHRSYSRDTNPSPKTCKGHEGEAGGLEKKEQHLELLSGTAEIKFCMKQITWNISHLIKITQEGLGN